MNTESVTKIIAIDDDPTGSQTVHGCLLLTRWDVDTLVQGLGDDSPLLFILSNTRGMDAQRAAAVTREICINLDLALRRLASEGLEISPVVVSRSDSTLRGHYPIETDVIAEVLGPFDAHFLVPAFFEGGRVTRDGVHYLEIDGEPVRVDQTEFARDSVFAFSTSFLPDYVEEKTGGRTIAAEVERFSLQDVRGDVTGRLKGLVDNACCVVDAETASDLVGFARQVMAVTGEGKRFLFRSAASLLSALADLPPQPVAASDMGRLVRNGRPGVVLVGSHVEKTSVQLGYLLEHTDVLPLHVDLDLLEQAPEQLYTDLVGQMTSAQKADVNVALYTSRGERQFPDAAERLAFGQRVSDFLMRLVKGLPRDIGFLISKGGITSNDTLSRGLALRTSRVVGQIHAGCSVVICPDDHPRYPKLPVVIFPGNVGGAEALTTVYDVLARQREAPQAGGIAA
jgi:uncharacterized protein YgbK (DUF1537 family)